MPNPSSKIVGYCNEKACNELRFAPGTSGRPGTAVRPQGFVPTVLLKGGTDAQLGRKHGDNTPPEMGPVSKRPGRKTFVCV